MKRLIIADSLLVLAVTAVINVRQARATDATTEEGD